MQYLTVFFKVFQYFNESLRIRSTSSNIAPKQPPNVSKILPRSSQESPKMPSWRRLGRQLRSLGALLAALGTLLAALGTLLGRSWDILGMLLVAVGRSWLRSRFWTLRSYSKRLLSNPSARLAARYQQNSCTMSCKKPRSHSEQPKRMNSL